MGITIKSFLVTTGIILCLPLAAMLTLAAIVVKRMTGKAGSHSNNDEDYTRQILDIEATQSDN
jgi:hypothetical protein